MEEKPKSKRKKLIRWILVDLAVAAIVVGLLLYRPRHYNPAVWTQSDPNVAGVHPYLAHDLGVQLYNGAQDQRPFDLEVLDENFNEAIAQFTWPQESEGVTFSAPEVVFDAGRIVVMGTAHIEGADFVLTIEVGPAFRDDGLLDLRVEKVKVGAMNITLLAKATAKRMYQKRLEMDPVDTRDIRAQVAASLLNNEPFDPVFRIEDKRIRLKGLSVADGRLIAHLVPAQ